MRFLKVVCSFCLLLIVTISGHAQIDFPVDLIAFVSDLDGDREIYTIYSDGTHLRQLTNNTSSDDYPSWSPDGSKIVYIHDYELHIMDANGSDSVLILNTLGARNPQWSPDNQWIVFEQESDILLLNLQTEIIQNLTNTPQELDQSPIWSFDSTRIIFNSTGDNPIPSARYSGYPRFGIHSMEIDGSNRELIHNGGGGIYGLSQNETGIIISTGFFNLDPTIFQYDPVTHTTTSLFSLGVIAYDAQFSPDGSKVVLVYNRQLAIMNANGENLIQITNIDGYILSPAWQPQITD